MNLTLSIIFLWWYGMNSLDLGWMRATIGTKELKDRLPKFVPANTRNYEVCINIKTKHKATGLEAAMRVFAITTDKPCSSYLSDMIYALSMIFDSETHTTEEVEAFVLDLPEDRKRELITGGDIEATGNSFRIVCVNGVTPPVRPVQQFNPQNWKQSPIYTATKEAGVNELAA